MEKRAGLVLVVAVGCVLGVGSVRSSLATDPPTMRLDPASIKIQGVDGATFTVDVRIEGVTNLGGIEFDVRFDDKSLDLIDIREGTFLSSAGGNPVCTKLNLSDVAFFGCLLTGKQFAVDGSGTIAHIDFSLRIPFSGLELFLVGCRAADSQGNLIALNGCKDSIVEISAVPPAVGGVSLNPLGPALGARRPAGHEDSWWVFVTLVASGAFVAANGTWLAYRRRHRNASRS
jgi:hypothetical protein